MLYGLDEQALTQRIYLDMRREMTDTVDTIIRYYIPDEKSYLEDYTVEFKIMFDIIMKIAAYLGVIASLSTSPLDAPAKFPLDILSKPCYNTIVERNEAYDRNSNDS